MRKEDKGIIIEQLANSIKEYEHFYLVDTTDLGSILIPLLIVLER